MDPTSVESAVPSTVEFRLPVGHVDSRGGRHRDGVLRVPRARDELAALRDFRVYLRRDAFLVVMLARLIERLGELEGVDVGLVERLAPDDLDLLGNLYRQLAGYGEESIADARGSRAMGTGGGGRGTP